MRNNQPPNTMRMMTMAIAGSACVAAGMMFVPVSALEGLTGPTGLSELVPATAAPLGDFARAMIAFGTGTITLGGLTMIALRQDGHGNVAHSHEAPASNGVVQNRTDIFRYLSAKMPWHQKPDDIRNLSDLARFNPINMCADTPARRPLLASQDLPENGLVDPVVERDRTLWEPVVPEETGPHSSPLILHTTDGPAKPSIGDMVNHFEAAVAQRQHRRAEHEAVAADNIDDIAADIAAVPGHSADPSCTQDVASQSLSEPRRPVLELVASAVVKDDDIDSALTAALATLSRMTAIAR